MKIKDITSFLETWAPPVLQESYDNSGLLLGDGDDSVQAALLALDVTESVVEEAIRQKCGLIIAHHPLIFKGMKRIGKRHWIDRCIRKAVAHDIAIYALHTNLDNVHTGVNMKIADKIGLLNTQILSVKSGTLSKLAVYVPTSDKEVLLDALFQAGAGKIGNYDRCSFQTQGMGTFRGNDLSSPALGTKNKKEQVEETKIEVLVPLPLEKAIIQAMYAAHPYEEVAYHHTPLDNRNQEVGAGMMGELKEEMELLPFLRHLKKVMHLSHLKHTQPVSSKIKKVAVCGGAGAFLTPKAIQAKADVFISSDFKYHDFFEANGQLTLVDIGHYESEVFTKDLLHDELSKTFTNFAFHLSKVNTNPIQYL